MDNLKDLAIENMRDEFYQINHWKEIYHAERELRREQDRIIQQYEKMFDQLLERKHELWDDLRLTRNQWRVKHHLPPSTTHSTSSNET